MEYNVEEEFCVHCLIEEEKLSANINGVCDSCGLQHFETLDAIGDEMGIMPIYTEYFPVGGRQIYSTGNKMEIYTTLPDDDPLIKCWLKPRDLHYFIPIMFPTLLASSLKNNVYAKEENTPR
jgi:hypothetical protein